MDLLFRVMCHPFLMRGDGRPRSIGCVLSELHQVTRGAIFAQLPEDLLEMKTNLETLGEVWKRQWLAEGRAEGKVEGKAEGKAEALVCLLAERFGTVRPSLRKRIHGANLATLECWFKRAIVAPDLPSVFARPR
jgi:hypothetical protein